MTQAAPATKFETLKQRIVSAISVAPSEFELRQLHAEAKKLANADSLGSVELRAMLACIEGDVEEADRLYRGVLRATGNSVERLFRYLMLLASAGYSSRLGEVYREFVVLSELPLQAREIVAKVLGYSGWAAESTMIRQQLLEAGYEIDAGNVGELNFATQKEGGDDRLPRSAVLEAMLTNAETLARVGVDDAWVADRVGDAIQFFRSRNTDLKAVRTIATPREDGNFGLLVNLYVDQTPEQAAESEWDLYGFMADRSPELLDLEDVGFAAIGMQLRESHAN